MKKYIKGNSQRVENGIDWF